MTEADGVFITQRETAPEIPPPIDPPGAAVETRAERLAIQQREGQEALQSILRLRKEAFQEIEKLIALIDASDEYVQTEREHDESELENDGEDREPDLGSFDRMMNQARSWGVTPSANILDAEVDDSDYEPDVDVEPDDDREWP